MVCTRVPLLFAWTQSSANPSDSSQILSRLPRPAVASATFQLRRDIRLIRMIQRCPQLLRSRNNVFHPFPARQLLKPVSWFKARPQATSTSNMASSTQQDDSLNEARPQLLNFRDLSTAAPDLVRSGRLALPWLQRRCGADSQLLLATPHVQPSIEMSVANCV